MSKEEVFDITEFRKRTGLKDGNWHVHKSKGNIPTKTVFNQQDVDDFLAKHTIAGKRAGKIQKKIASVKTKALNGKKIQAVATLASKEPKYTGGDLAKMLNVNHQNIGNWRKRGQLPKIELYSDYDVAQLLANPKLRSLKNKMKKPTTKKRKNPIINKRQYIKKISKPSNLNASKGANLQNENPFNIMEQMVAASSEQNLLLTKLVASMKKLESLFR